jgi:hypothetical protein
LLSTIAQWPADLVEAHIRSGATADAQRAELVRRVEGLT